MFTICKIRRHGLEMYQLLRFSEYGAKEIAVCWSIEGAEKLLAKYSR